LVASQGLNSGRKSNHSPRMKRAEMRVATHKRHDTIGLDHQRLGHGRVVRRRLLRSLHVRDGRPLFTFQFGTGGFSVGAQRLSAYLHPGQGLEQLSCLSEDGHTAYQRFPVLKTATGPLFGTETQGRLSGSQLCPHPR
jgi:hypothetical protein